MGQVPSAAFRIQKVVETLQSCCERSQHALLVVAKATFNITSYDFHLIMIWDILFVNYFGECLLYCDLRYSFRSIVCLQCHAHLISKIRYQQSQSKWIGNAGTISSQHNFTCSLGFFFCSATHIASSLICLVSFRGFVLCSMYCPILFCTRCKRVVQTQTCQTQTMLSNIHIYSWSSPVPKSDRQQNQPLWSRYINGAVRYVH